VFPLSAKMDGGQSLSPLARWLGALVLLLLLALAARGWCAPYMSTHTSTYMT
jgi:hypothetical protein